MSETPPAEPINVYEMIWMMLTNFAEIAWVKMGLRPDPLTSEIGVDLPQAKAAVDAITALAAIVEPELEGAEKRDLQNLVRDLRVNYVQRSQG